MAFGFEGGTQSTTSRMSSMGSWTLGGAGSAHGEIGASMEAVQVITKTEGEERARKYMLNLQSVA